MTVSKEWLDTEIAERSKEPHRTMYSRTLLDALKELASRRAADEVTTKRTRADFLFPANPGSVEEAAFEFANARTEEYRREWWETLQRRLRAAEEGAVTVEGYADLRVFNGSPWNTLRGAANMMRVFMEGIDGDIPVTVKIRRKR